MKTYRTPSQYQSIVQNALNGNWSDAAKDCVEYGFYANDLIRMHQDAKDEVLFYEDEMGDTCAAYPFGEDTDIAIVVELAAQLRNN